MAAIVTGSEYLALPRAKETWLIEPVVPTSGAVLLYGDPKVGKSFAALQLAVALSDHGVEDWFGFPVKSHGPVVYVQLDTPRSLWADRLEEVRSSGVDTDSVHFSDRETLDCFPFDILRGDHFDLLYHSLKAIKPIAVIMDTLKESHSAEENDSNTMQKVVASLVAATYPAALILISHSRKPAGEYTPDLINDSRGSSYLPGRMDSIIRFTAKTLFFTGRALEQGSIKLERTDVGTWKKNETEDRLHELVVQVASDPNLPSLLQKSTELSTRTGKSIEACRSLLRRRLPSLAHP